jgi:hypothetical protein
MQVLPEHNCGALALIEVFLATVILLSGALYLLVNMSSFQIALFAEIKAIGTPVGCAPP